MATRWATKTGNWSDVTLWDGGTTLPDTEDLVYSNGFNVTIDQNITVNSLRNHVGGGVVAGGQFVILSTRTLNVVGGIINGHTSATVRQESDSRTLTITGDLSAEQAEALLMNSDSTLILNGDVFGSNGTLGSDICGLSKAAGKTVGGTWTINGQVKAQKGRAISWLTAITHLIVNGNVTGSDIAARAGISATIAGRITVNGNVAPGNFLGAYGIYSSYDMSDLNIYGEVSGSDVTQTPGLFNAASNANWRVITASRFRCGSIGTHPVTGICTLNGAQVGETVTNASFTVRDNALNPRKLVLYAVNRTGLGAGRVSAGLIT